MKLFIKLMLFIIVAAVAAPFFIKGPDGRPLMTFDRLHTPSVKLPDLGKAADAVKATLNTAGEERAKVIAVYKWQDAHGVWHFADNAEEGRRAQQVSVNPNANMVHFTAQGDPSSPTENDSGGTAPVVGIAKLIGDANNVSELHKEHAARQERAMEE